MARTAGGLSGLSGGGCDGQRGHLGLDLVSARLGRGFSSPGAFSPTAEVSPRRDPPGVDPYNSRRGDWCIGNTVVSKTATPGSIPGSPAARKPRKPGLCGFAERYSRRQCDPGPSRSPPTPSAWEHAPSLHAIAATPGGGLTDWPPRRRRSATGASLLLRLSSSAPLRPCARLC